jgi:hypothetical protein
VVSSVKAVQVSELHSGAFFIACLSHLGLQIQIGVILMVMFNLIFLCSSVWFSFFVFNKASWYAAICMTTATVFVLLSVHSV